MLFVIKNVDKKKYELRKKTFVEEKKRIKFFVGKIERKVNEE